MSAGTSGAAKQVHRGWIKPLISVVLFVALLGGMVLCTEVRTIAEAEAADPGSLDIAAYATKDYDENIVPYVQENAVELKELHREIAAGADAAGEKYGNRESPSTSWAFPVKFTAVAGEPKGSLLPLKVEGFPEKPELKLMIGPAITGTALRDVTGSVTFQDFANQLAYQDVGTEINNRVKELVLKDLDKENLEGKTLEIVGAFSLGSNKNVYQIVAISIEVK